MIQRRLVNHVTVANRTDIDKELLKKLKKLTDKHSIQYALLWYIYLSNTATLRELYRVYNYLSGKIVRENTVRKQLQMLERKGLIEKRGDTYHYLVDPREVIDLFDKERSKAGRIGATIRHMKLNSRSLKISPGLYYYTRQVVEEAKKLVRKEKRATALDLITHTLLPLRENEILWLWHDDIFIYYIRKTRSGQFRAIRSKEIAELLRKLGFTPGIMILHTLGHKEASRIIKKIFTRGPYSWPWARSLSYGLKELGLLQETSNFRIQLKRIDKRIELILWDLYTKQLIATYTLKWNHETPEPLKNRKYIVATVLGRQHIKKEIEMDSYIKKWKI